MKVGYFPNIVVDLQDQIRAYGNSDYSFIVTPLVAQENSVFDPICDLHLASQGKSLYAIRLLSAFKMVKMVKKW